MYCDRKCLLNNETPKPLKNIKFQQILIRDQIYPAYRNNDSKKTKTTSDITKNSHLQMYKSKLLLV